MNINTISTLIKPEFGGMTPEEFVRHHFPTAFVKGFKDGKEVNPEEEKFDYCLLYAEHPDTGEEYELLSDSGVPWSGNPHGEGKSTEATSIEHCWNAAAINLPLGYYTGDFTGPF